MAQNQKLWERVETVKITASADRAANDLVNEGNWYGVCADIIANTEEGMIHIRGAFELTKETASEVIATGDFIEWVAGGTVQKYSAGTKIGKAYEASGNGVTTVIVILMPELY
jgi:predicted RecA/RadA family phage recombinase